MNFFTDTNVPIAYTVIHDKWHEKANKFIENYSDSLFWSNLVRNEYNDKFGEILDDIDYFFEIAEDGLKINKNDFVNYYAFESFILDKTAICKLDDIKKHNIIEHFWNKNSFSEGISSIVFIKFKNFRKDFDKLYLLRDKRLNKIMKLHECGENNYLKYVNYALKLNSWGIHSPDCKIILDAHDCGIKHKDLVFISLDSKMHEALSGHDISFLNIAEFKSCN